MFASKMLRISGAISALALDLGFCGQSAHAATYTWDNSGNGTAFDGGSSSWRLTGSNWWNSSSDLLWSNSTDTATRLFSAPIRILEARPSMGECCC